MRDFILFFTHQLTFICWPNQGQKRPRPQWLFWSLNKGVEMGPDPPYSPDVTLTDLVLAFSKHQETGTSWEGQTETKAAVNPRVTLKEVFKDCGESDIFHASFPCLANVFYFILPGCFFHRENFRENGIPPSFCYGIV